MKNRLLFALAVSSSCLAGQVTFEPHTYDAACLKPNVGQSSTEQSFVNKLINIANKNRYCVKPAPIPFDSQEFREVVKKEASTLSPLVVDKIISVIKCAQNYNIEHNHILTVIDYSLPSNEKRLWIFDLKEKKLLFHTYVSHGIKSGELLTNNFSNKNNSKATSIGVYTTEKAYYGRDGISLRLDGIDRGFNDNASGRAIVMHGGWYVEEPFIKKYGRAGRSWGCPAVPMNEGKQIINTIKDKSIFVAYYPSDAWFAKSKYLKCDKINATSMFDVANITKQNVLETPTEEPREEVLFVAASKHNKQLDTRPVLAVSADTYEQIFHTKVPLKRMLRRQINNVEYVALSNAEFKTIVMNHYKSYEEPSNKIENQPEAKIDSTHATPINDYLESVMLISPMLKLIRGYYETQMNIVNLGKIKDVIINAADSYTIHFEKNSVITLQATNQFVRWVGL